MTLPVVSPEIPAAKWRVILTVLRRLPQAGLSRGFGRVADVQIPPALRSSVIGTFASALGINVAEAEKPLTAYTSLNDFFVRRLKPGVRKWPVAENLAGSPVDGVIGQLGRIASGELIQAKGRRYTAAELLDDGDQARRYADGSFLTIYLSPRHYHRIHTPLPGSIPLARHVPGTLLPVNGPAVQHVDRLFVRNERLICYVDGALGRVAVVAVGAYNVGRISAAFDPQWSGADGVGWVTNRRGTEAESKTYSPAKPVLRGAEIMAFHLGSTVVLLFEPGVELRHELEVEQEIALGAPIAVVENG
jgi:phosphatidylserine decarboxylase